MKKRKILAILTIASLLAGCNLQVKNNETKEVSNKKETNVIKNTWSIENKKTDIVKNNRLKWNWLKYIWFVATWCPHCQNEIPILSKFYNDYSGEVNMEINVINKKPFPWIKKLPENYKNPKSYQYYTHKKCGYIPSYVIINKSWEIIDKKCWWSLSYNELKNKLLSNNEHKTNLKIKTNKMKTEQIVKIWDTIKVDYIWSFKDGKVFDTSIESEAKKAGIYNKARTYSPLEFKVGAWQMIKCFDKWVVWMKLWETKDIVCNPDEAYWKCDPKKIEKIEKSKLEAFAKAWYKLEKWTELPTQYWNLKIVDADKNSVTIDMNNPMCGKILNFKVTVKSIQE